MDAISDGYARDAIFQKSPCEYSLVYQALPVGLSRRDLTQNCAMEELLNEPFQNELDNAPSLILPLWDYTLEKHRIDLIQPLLQKSGLCLVSEFDPNENRHLPNQDHLQE